MKPATIAQIKSELKHLSAQELVETCLKLARFKKENKELLTYLLFEASNEEGFIEAVKEDMDTQFSEINASSMYYIKKSIRKILRSTKKYIRYSKLAETEADLLIYFCKKVINMYPSVQYNVSMKNLLDRQIALVQKIISKLHEDLQYDYHQDLKSIL
jgi:hypothetical protein